MLNYEALFHIYEQTISLVYLDGTGIPTLNSRLSTRSIVEQTR